MVITVQGYNGKRNKSTLAASILSLSTSTIKGQKTLVIELIDQDLETVEMMLNGSGLAARIGESDTLIDAGIDALLREVDSIRLSKPEFDQYCIHILQQENRLDVASITKQAGFVQNLHHRLDSLVTLVENAKEVYDTIILLCPTGDEQLTKKLNTLESHKVEKKQTKNGEVEYHPPLIDKSIYCIRQGFPKKGKCYGQKVIYMVTEFEDASYYTLNHIKKEYMEKGEAICYIPHFIKVTDAAQRGQLTGFVVINREADPLDIHYPFIWAMQASTNVILGLKDYEVDYSWEEEKREEKKLYPLDYIPREQIIEEPAKPVKKGIFSGLFGGKKQKTVQPAAINKPLDFTEEPEDNFSNSVVDEILAASNKKRKNDVGNIAPTVEKVDLSPDKPISSNNKKAAPKAAAKAQSTKTSKTVKKETVKNETKKQATVKATSSVKTSNAKTTAAKLDSKTKVTRQATAATVKAVKATASATAQVKPVAKSRVCKSYPDGRIMVEGNIYTSVSAAAKAYGKNPSTISKRLKAGKKIKEAFEL